MFNVVLTADCKRVFCRLKRGSLDEMTTDSSDLNSNSSLLHGTAFIDQKSRQTCFAFDLFCHFSCLDLVGIPNLKAKS